MVVRAVLDVDLEAGAELPRVLLERRLEPARVRRTANTRARVGACFRPSSLRSARVIDARDARHEPRAGRSSRGPRRAVVSPTSSPCRRSNRAIERSPRVSEAAHERRCFRRSAVCAPAAPCPVGLRRTRRSPSGLMIDVDCRVASMPSRRERAADRSRAWRHLSAIARAAARPKLSHPLRTRGPLDRNGRWGSTASSRPTPSSSPVLVRGRILEHVPARTRDEGVDAAGRRPGGRRGGRTKAVRASRGRRAPDLAVQAEDQELPLDRILEGRLVSISCCRCLAPRWPCCGPERPRRCAGRRPGDERHSSA
jgi:hypothetical protein